MVEENDTIEQPAPVPPPPPAMVVSEETPEPRGPAPAMEKLGTVAGPMGGGTPVVIRGSGFLEGCEVKVDRVPVKASFVSPTELAFTTLPRNLPGAVDVDVINPDGQRTLLVRAFEYCMSPALTGIEPDHAPETGGTRATLLGTDLRAEAEVRIGASRPRIDYRGPTRIDLEIGAHPAGTYDVELVNPDGQGARLVGAFRFDARPRIERLVPDHGPLGATTRFAVEGDGFRTGCVVYLGGARIPAELESSTRILATALPHETHGPLALRVVNADGLDVEVTAAFRYDPPAGPRIASVSPARVPSGREQAAIVTGEGFVEGCSVRVAGTPAPARFVSPTQIEVSLPALDRIGWVDVEVANLDLQSHRLEAAYELQGPPRLATVQPREGSAVGGDLLTLNGLGFDRRCEVSIGGFPAKTSWEADTTVRAVAPPRALEGAVDVVLTNPDGQSASLAAAFTYLARRAAVVASMEPKKGPTTGGTGVLVRGEHLEVVAHVRVGGEPAGFKYRDGELAFATPPRAHEGAADVELRTRDGASTVLKNAFTYAPVPPPAIRSLTPNRGGPAGGTEVTIAGENFAAGMSVLVDGEKVARAKVRDASTIVFTTPPGEAGAMADVAVRSPTGQQAVVKRAFLYDPRYA
ncbi:MAG TPA: IPT/TIG domain-containing protein [Polyangiaceae bacterium]|jgi:hypothetical protein